MQDAKALASLVRAMRQAQATYFKTRSQEALLASKNLERQVDNAVSALLDEPAQGGLTL